MRVFRFRPRDLGVSIKCDVSRRSDKTVELEAHGRTVCYDQSRFELVQQGIGRTQGDSIRSKMRELEKKLARQNLSSHQRLVASDLLAKCVLRLVEIQTALLRP